MDRNRRAKAKVNRPKQNGRKRQGLARRSVATSLKPPQFNPNVAKHHKFRFQCSTVSVQTITNLSIMGSCGSLGTAALTTTNFNKSFRIKKVEIWAPAPTVGGITTASIEWIGGSVNSPNKEVSDTSMNISAPVHLVSVPPVESLAAFWNAPVAGSAVNMFTLRLPVNAVVDLSLDLIENDQETTNVTNTVVTVVAGNIYYLALDGPASNLITPVGLNTTF